MFPNNLRNSAPVRFATVPTVQRMPMVIKSQGSPIPSPSLAPTTTMPVRPTAPNPKEHVVRLPNTERKYGIMEFASGIVIDLKEGNTVEMKREINPFTYRTATNLDATAASSNTIVTSLGVVLPKTGAGSECGREQKEALKRKRYAVKGTNHEDLPWLLSNRLTSEKRTKQFRGIKKGGIKDNSSYYVFIQNGESFDAFPVDDWHSFTPTNVFPTMDFDEAEKKYEDRYKTYSKWINTHRPVKVEEEGLEEKEKGKKSNASKLDGFKLLDTDDLNLNNDDEDDDDDDQSDKKGSSKGKNSKKSKKNQGTLSSDDETEHVRSKLKKQKTKQKKKRDEQAEDSDDGDHEDDEIDYTSDESSDEEDDIRDVDTVKSSMKYEAKGIDEEMKIIPDIDKKLDQMDESANGIDFDDDDEEEVLRSEDDEEENGKGNKEDLSDVGKLLKSEAISKEIDSSSDDDDMDDSDDPDRDPMQSNKSVSNLQPIPSQQIKTEKGHKKAKEEEIRALKSQVISMSSSSATSSEPLGTITEEKVRNLLMTRMMTTSELIQKFLPKGEHQRTKEFKERIVEKLADIFKQIPIENVKIDGKAHIRLKK